MAKKNKKSSISTVLDIELRKVGIVTLIFIGLLVLMTSFKPQPSKVSPTQTPSPTINVPKELKEKISYQLPNEWTENTEQEKELPDALVFTTNDFEPGYGIKGAMVAIRKENVNPDSLIDYIVVSSPNPGRKVTSDEVTLETLNGRESGYIVSCWEGCMLSHFIRNKDSVYEISYTCGTASNCNNKNGTIFESTYYQDFLSILYSLKFR